jgi:hypothetical protein
MTDENFASAMFSTQIKNNQTKSAGGPFCINVCGDCDDEHTLVQ